MGMTSDQNEDTWGSRLGRHLKLIAMSQAELGEKMGFGDGGRQRVNNWIRSGNEPELDVMLKVASLTGMPVAPESDGSLDHLEFSLAFRQLQQAKTALDTALEAMSRQAQSIGLDLSDGATSLYGSEGATGPPPRRPRTFRNTATEGLSEIQKNRRARKRGASIDDPLQETQ